MDGRWNASLNGFGIRRRQDEVVILVMGATGSGKSFFIKSLTNDPNIVIGTNSITPVTNDIQIISYIHQATGRRIKIVDTPSFDDSREGLTDTEVIKKITGFLLNLCRKGKKLNGLIYVQSIRFIRFTSLLSRSLGMFQSLCGKESFKNVVVLTTFWDTLQENEGKFREEKLRTNYFTELMEGGAHFMQHDLTLDCAEDVLRYVFTYHPTDVKIQSEIHVEGKTLEETAVGSMHRKELEKIIGEFEKQRAELGFEIEEAKGINPSLAEDLMKKQELIAFRLKSWEKERQELKRGMEEEKRFIWFVGEWSRRKQQENRELAAGLEKGRTEREMEETEMERGDKEQEFEEATEIIEVTTETVKEAEQQQETSAKSYLQEWPILHTVRNIRSTVPCSSLERFHPYTFPRPLPPPSLPEESSSFTRPFLRPGERPVGSVRNMQSRVSRQSLVRSNSRTFRKPIFEIWRPSMPEKTKSSKPFLRERPVDSVLTMRSTGSHQSHRFHPYASPKSIAETRKPFPPEVRRRERREIEFAEERKFKYSSDERRKTAGIKVEESQKLAKEENSQMEEDAKGTFVSPKLLAPQLPSSALASQPELKASLGVREDNISESLKNLNQPSSLIGSTAIHDIPSMLVPSLETALPPGATASVSSKVLKLTPRLNAMLKNNNQRERLLDCQGDDAQRLLDLFQSLLDIPDLKIKFRSRLLLATRELAKRAGILPRCYELHDIHVNYEEDYVDGGGFADIYKCNFRGQVICLKAIRLFSSSEKAKLMRDMSKEAVIWAQLDHPNILRMLGIYHGQPRICLVSLWMEAGNLVQYLENCPTAPRRHLTMDVAQGLKYLHDNGIVHGDLKGVNVLINEQEIACLADFGLSSLPTVMHTQAVTSSLGVGSVFWTAPELFGFDTPSVKPTTASDMYSWACVCYEIFTGKTPFWHLTRFALPLHVKAGGRPQRPHESDLSWTTYGLNQGLWSIMEDCWKESPDERPEVEYAIAQLKLMLGDGVRKLGNTHKDLPPSHFRQRMNDDIDIAAVLSILDRI